MRIDRILILTVLLAACKTTQAPSTSEYREDLSVHRLDLSDSQAEEAKSDSVTVVTNDEAVYYPGEITQELDSVNQLIVANNKKQKYWDGYVIQVYRGNSRNNAYKVKSGIDDIYPELNAQVSYYQPTYRVKAGSFFDRLEATRMFNILKESYPRALLLPEKLPLPQSPEE